MSAEKKKRGFVLRGADRVALGIVLALVVIAAVLTGMKRFGLAPANGALLLHLPALALAVLVGWVFF